jgi:hypothetical protein
MLLEPELEFDDWLDIKDSSSLTSEIFSSLVFSTYSDFSLPFSFFSFFEISVFCNPIFPLLLDIEFKKFNALFVFSISCKESVD